MPRINKTFFELLSKAWNKTIGFTGYDPVEKTIWGQPVSYDVTKPVATNGLPIESNAHHKMRTYRNSVRRQIADFFLAGYTGMRHDTGADDVGMTLLKNLIGLPEAGAPRWMKIFQYVLMPLSIIIKLVWIPLTIARNIIVNTAKVLLKLIPELTVSGLGELQKRIDEKLKLGNVNASQQFGLELAHVLLSILKVPFQVIGFVAGALLSPIDNARMAYKKAGLLGAIGSAVVTALVGLILFPVAVKVIPTFINGTVLPWVSAFLTAKAPWLVSAAHSVSAFLAPATSWVANIFSSAYDAVYNVISNSLSAAWQFFFSDPYSFVNMMTNMAVSNFSVIVGLDITAKLMGFGAVLGMAATVIGTPFVRLQQFISNKIANASQVDGVPAPRIVAPNIGEVARTATTLVNLSVYQAQQIAQLQKDVLANDASSSKRQTALEERVARLTSGLSASSYRLEVLEAEKGQAVLLNKQGVFAGGAEQSNPKQNASASNNDSPLVMNLDSDLESAEEAPKMNANSVAGEVVPKMDDEQNKLGL